MLSRRIKKTALILFLAATMLLSACKVVIMPGETESTKRPGKTTADTTREATPRETAVTTFPVTADTPLQTQTVPADTGDLTEPVQSEIPTEPPKTAATEVAPPEPIIDLDALSLPELEERFFLKQMAEESMLPFREIYRAVMAFESRVRFAEPITTDRMSNLMLLLNYACPEVMQIDSEYTYYTNGDGMCTSIEFQYILDEDTYRWACDEIAGIFTLVREQTAGRSDYEKEKFVYELLIEACAYDEFATHSGTCYGAMLEGVARCEGYAKSFMWLMWALDIPCMTVTGDILSNGDRHSWNIVEINGVYGHVDTTYDDVEQGGEQFPTPYGFFNVSDALVGQDRTIDRLYYLLGLPACGSEEMNYHVQNSSFVDFGISPVDCFVELIYVTVESGETVLSIQCADAAGYEELEAGLDPLLEEVLNSVLNRWSYRWYTYPDSHTIVVTLEY